MTARCRATFEPPRLKDASDTHTCARLEHAEGPHLCPTCQSQWLSGVGVIAVTPPGNNPYRSKS
jgi:hypothetical protein